MSQWCRDCGKWHRTGSEALACDLRVYDVAYVRKLLARLGVSSDVIASTLQHVEAGDVSKS